jgi:hypothetical protein
MQTQGSVGRGSTAKWPNWQAERVSWCALATPATLPPSSRPVSQDPAGTSGTNRADAGTSRIQAQKGDDMTKSLDRELAPPDGLTAEELAAEEVTELPDKEAVSILDLNVDADIALDLAAPIDLAVAANANVAAPIDAAVGANVLSAGSTAQALSDQGVMITQDIVGDSTAEATQVSGIDQANDAPEAGVPGATGEVPDVGAAAGAAAGAAGDAVSGVDTGDMLSGDVLSVDVNVAADADLTAPIAGAIAANANVAAPIDAAAAANIGSVASEAVAIANQDAIIDQSIEGDTSATTDQESDISQGT